MTKTEKGHRNGVNVTKVFIAAQFKTFVLGQRTSSYLQPKKKQEYTNLNRSETFILNLHMEEATEPLSLQRS